MIVFRCAACGTQITVPLVELDDASRVSRDDGAPMVPRGTYLPVYRHPNTRWVATLGDDQRNDVYVNLADVVNTHLGGVLNGCCGIDRCDGINTFCPQGHGVGTEFSDCWGPHRLTIARASSELEQIPSND